MNSSRHLETDFDEINILKNKVKSLESNLILSAQFGKELLDAKQSLCLEIDELKLSHLSEIEGLEQSKYALTRQVQTKDDIIESLKSELDFYRDKFTEFKSKNEEQQDQIEKSDQIIKLLREESQSLACDLEVIKTQEKYFKDRVEELRIQLEQQATYFNNKSIEETSYNNESLYCEINELKLENADLKNGIIELRSNLCATRSELDQSKERISDLLLVEDQLANYKKQIQEYKSNVEELQNEIQLLKIENLDPKRKGNSLFAEIEDKRQALEKNLITERLKNKVINDKCRMWIKAFNKLKIQYASLMSSTRLSVDREYVIEIENCLTSIQHQNLELFNQVISLEKKCESNKCDLGCNKSISNTHSILVDSLNYEKKRVTSLQRELTDLMFQISVRNDKILTLNRNIRELREENKSLLSDKNKLEAELNDPDFAPAATRGSKAEKAKPEKLPVYIHPTFEFKELNARATEELESLSDTCENLKPCHNTSVLGNGEDLSDTHQKVKPFKSVSDSEEVENCPPQQISLVDNSPKKPSWEVINAPVVSEEPLVEVDDNCQVQ